MTLPEAISYLKTATVNDKKAVGAINVVEAVLRDKEKQITALCVEGRELKRLREAIEDFVADLEKIGEVDND
jgi:hypothetical protein